MIDHLPTPLARVAQRFQSVGPDSSADSFLLLSYLVEAAIKAIAIGLHAGVRAGAPQSAYAIAYSLVRADGLGDWEEAIGRMSSHPLAGYLPPDFHQALAWLTKRRSPGDAVGLSGAAPAVEMLRCGLGMDSLGDRNLQTVRHLIRELMLIRLLQVDAICCGQPRIGNRCRSRPPRMRLPGVGPRPVPRPSRV